MFVKAKIASRGCGKKQTFYSLRLSLGLRVMARGSEGWVVGSRFDGSVQDPQIVRDLSRQPDKPGIAIFVCGSAHEYTLNAVFTPYLNWSKVPFLGFFSIFATPIHLHEQVRKCGRKS